MAEPHDFEGWHFARTRIGDGAFHCRCADAVLGFEFANDASILEDAIRRFSVPLGAFIPATPDDFKALAYESGMSIAFLSDAFDGEICLALPQWCCTESNLCGIASEISCGWGTVHERMQAYA